MKLIKIVTIILYLILLLPYQNLTGNNNDIVISKTTKIYPNGKRRIANIYPKSKGKLEHIKKISYFLNGNIRFEKSIKNGIRHGKYIRYYPNGMKWVETVYRYGKQHGYRIEWSFDGTLTSQMEFQNDKPVIGEPDYSEEKIVKGAPMRRISYYINVSV